jgi:hypothetical protein
MAMSSGSWIGIFIGAFTPIFAVFASRAFRKGEKKD